MTEPVRAIRVDKWLWHARLAKSRTFAQELVAGGMVRINREKALAPSRQVRPGDVLTLALPGAVRVLRVLDCGVRRGPFSEARLLYEELLPSPARPSGEA